MTHLKKCLGVNIIRIFDKETLKRKKDELLEKYREKKQQKQQKQHKQEEQQQQQQETHKSNSNFQL